MIDFQSENGRLKSLDKIWIMSGIIPRRVAEPGRLTAPLLPWPGNVCIFTDIHTRTAALRMTLQTQIAICWEKILRKVNGDDRIENCDFFKLGNYFHMLAILIKEND